MMTLHRWSLPAAYRLTSSAAQRTKTGTPQKYSPLKRAYAAVVAVLYATNPAIRIGYDKTGASARLTNLRTARLSIVIGTVLLAAAFTVIIGTDVAVIYVPLSLAVPVLSGIVGSSIETHRSAVAIGDNAATHLLTDVTRHPEGQPGSGARLVADLAALDRRITGTAANTDVWKKVYAGTATAIGHAGNGGVHFVLVGQEI